MSFYDLIGYVGLALNLYSMYMKGEYRLRLFAMLANAIYIIYGFLISAMPIAIGCSIAVILHLFRLKNLKTYNHVKYSKSNYK